MSELSTASTSRRAPGTHRAEPHRRVVAAPELAAAGVFGANERNRLPPPVRSSESPGRPQHAARFLIVGIAGLVAGAVAMALGEYFSVSSQRDTERALLDKERAEVATSPAKELEELAAIYVAKGASVSTARRLAEELTSKDAFAAHVDVELGIDPEALANAVAPDCVLG